MAVALLPAAAVGTSVKASAATAKASSGRHAKWVDRIDLPEYAKDFYSTLEEAADGDKEDDFLIDVTKATKLNGGYAILARSLTGTTETKSVIDNKKASVQNSGTAYLAAAYDAFNYDHPEIFWLTGNTKIYVSEKYSYVTSGSTGKTVYTYTINLYFVLKESGFDVRQSGYTSSSKIYSGISNRNKYVKNIMSGVKSSWTDEQKVIYFNKILTKQNEYKTNFTSNDNVDTPASWECISALKGSTGKNGPVCEGYTRAFKVLCDEAGITCTLVTGTASSSLGTGPHMWAYVKIDGKWYACDVTWDDPQVSGKSGATTGYENTDWLLVGSSTVIDGKKFSQSHKISNVVSSGGFAFTNGPVLATSKYSAPKPSKVKVNKTFTSSTSVVKITWNKVSGVDGYIVYRYNNSTKKWAKIKTLTGANKLSLRNTGLKAGTEYKYKVCAYKGSGISNDSAVITTATLPSKSKITKTAKTATTVTLTWNKQNCSGYKIQKYDSAKKTWVTVKKVGSTTTSYKISGLKKSTTYKFRIQAYKSAGSTYVYGTASDTKTVKTASK
jgi:hypothetical protein